MKSIVPVKKNKGGHPSHYNEKIHIPMLEEVLNAGYGRIHFCAKATISIKTFNNWKQKHKKFRKVYNDNLPKGAILSEEYAKIQGKDLNFKSWEFIHKNRFGEIYNTHFNLKHKNVDDKMHAAWKALAKGKISPAEFNQMTSGIMSQIKIKELELKTKELELKQKELEMNKANKLDMSGATDEMVEACMLILTGKAKAVKA